MKNRENIYYKQLNRQLYCKRIWYNIHIGIIRYIMYIPYKMYYIKHFLLLHLCTIPCILLHCWRVVCFCWLSVTLLTLRVLFFYNLPWMILVDFFFVSMTSTPTPNAQDTSCIARGRSRVRYLMVTYYLWTWPRGWITRLTRHTMSTYENINLAVAE